MGVFESLVSENPCCFRRKHLLYGIRKAISQMPFLRPEAIMAFSDLNDTINKMNVKARGFPVSSMDMSESW